jgi:hypothetical protein
MSSLFCLVTVGVCNRGSRISLGPNEVVGKLDQQASQVAVGPLRCSLGLRLVRTAHDQCSIVLMSAIESLYCALVRPVLRRIEFLSKPPISHLTLCFIQAHISEQRWHL